jgi:hypothetical protein
VVISNLILLQSLQLIVHTHEFFIVVVKTNKNPVNRDNLSKKKLEFKTEGIDSDAKRQRML